MHTLSRTVTDSYLKIGSMIDYLMYPRSQLTNLMITRNAVLAPLNLKNQTP